MSGGISQPETPEAKSHRIDVPGDSSSFGDGFDDKRLWFGNLDTRVTEFVVMKLAQKFGQIRKMDFLYHKGGPDKGMSKGYCFISFHTWEAAEQARKHLDGKRVMRRPMYVKWAHGSRYDDLTEPTKKKEGPISSESADKALASASMPSANNLTSASSEAKIQAIEAKLKLMEATNKDFSVHQPIQANPAYNPLDVAPKPDNKKNSRSAPYNRRGQSGGGYHKHRR